MARPMLDDLELQQVQTIEVDGDQVWVQHGIPALEGDFLQGLGRRASQVTLTGVLTGAEVADSLKKLRDKFRAAAPVTFVADIATAIRLDQVLIEEMGVRELAGRPARFEYAFTLREFTPATPTEIIIPPPPPPPPPPRTLESVLEVQVIVEGDPNFDHAQTTVRVQGTDETGGAVDRTLPNDDPAVRQGDLWTVNPFPAGTYTATATTRNPQMTGSTAVTLPLGQTQRAVITLRQGQTIATAFVIHYTFDRAFVEPCMRHVLRQVADFAAAHRDQRFIIVGHTDESGSDTYNQSLSERRARGAHAFLTFGRDAQSADAAVAEWNELRQARPSGVTLSVRDSWGAREYQHMLQDLGLYNGQVHGTHDAATDQAVRDFQGANGLNVDGVVGDATWPVLIRAYMAQDSLSVPEDQFMPNADPADGCDQGFVRWLGCGEKMTASSPRPPMCSGPDPAWRPNRRTELLFVRASTFPCEIAKPVTFDLTPAGGTGWCLGPGDPNARCCFLTRNAEEQDKFLVQPAEPGSFVVRGRIQFEDGTPLADTEYVLIAPDGEFMNGEVTCADASGARKGTPLRGRTDANGNLTDSAGNVGYPNNPKGPGTYTLAIAADVVARNEGEPIGAAKGPNVCARLDGSRDLVVVVVGRAVVNVRPTIAPAGNAVVVRKPHTNPQRRAVTLSVNQPFTGSGTFTRSSDAIRFFDAAVGGNEITFNGVDNVFTDAQLAAGHTVFTEGARASAAVDDVELRLVVTVNGTPGLGATARMTAVELTLDIALSRTAPGVDPPLLSQQDKVNIGRFLQVPDPGLRHERAMLIVRPPQPAGFTGDLVLARISDQVELLADELPAVGQAPLADPQVIAAATIPATGTRFFIQGRAPSIVARDTGYRLGINNVEPDGDRIAATVIQVDMVDTPTAVAPPATSIRFGLWDNAFRADGTVFNDAAEANNFVGADTRRFHLRVRDASRRNAGHISVNWFGVDQAGNDFQVPGDRSVALVETAANSGVFISRALMLINDEVDNDQATHSGLPAGVPDAGVVRNRNQSNHRLRRATMRGSVVCEYTHPIAPARPMTVRLPVFERNPEARRRLPLQIFVLRVSAGGAPVIPTAAGSALWATDIRITRETYERIGLTVETVVAPGTPAADIVTVDGDQVVLITVNALNPPAGINPANLSLADETAIGAAFPTIPGTSTVRVFFAGGLASGNRGESAPDIDFAAAADRGTCFIDSVRKTPYTMAHEVGHILTNKSVAVNTGHYRAPAVPAGNRLHNNQNLMRNGTSAAEGVNQSKRLWDANDGDGLNQFTVSRASPYTRAF